MQQWKRFWLTCTVLTVWGWLASNALAEPQKPLWGQDYLAYDGRVAAFAADYTTDGSIYAVVVLAASPDSVVLLKSDNGGACWSEIGGRLVASGDSISEVRLATIEYGTVKGLLIFSLTRLGGGVLRATRFSTAGVFNAQSTVLTGILGDTLERFSVAPNLERGDTLVLAFGTKKGSVGVTRSVNAGATWGAYRLLVVGFTGLPDLAYGAKGAYFLACYNSSTGEIQTFVSRDYGLTWTGPAAVARDTLRLALDLQIMAEHDANVDSTALWIFTNRLETDALLCGAGISFCFQLDLFFDASRDAGGKWSADSNLTSTPCCCNAGATVGYHEILPRLAVSKVKPTRVSDLTYILVGGACSGVSAVEHLSSTVDAPDIWTVPQAVNVNGINEVIPAQIVYSNAAARNGPAIFYAGKSGQGLYLQAGWLAATAGPVVCTRVAATASVGQGFDVVATVTDTAGLAQVKLFYRIIGRNAFGSIPMTGSSNTYIATIPAESVTVRGLEYYVEATNNNSQTTLQPASAPSVPAKVAAVITNLVSPVFLPAAAYRMVAFPFLVYDSAATGTLFDDLGSYNNTLWRLFRWNPTSATPAYDEYPALPPFAAGKGFWLISRNPAQFDASGISTVSDNTNHVDVSLDRGWNQISSPYFWNVKIDSVRVDTGGAFTASFQQAVNRGILDSTMWELNLSGSGYLRTHDLSPWSGAWIFNQRNYPIRLRVPAREQAGLGKIALAAPPPGWQVSVALSAGQYEDRENLFGVHPDARPGRDKFDLGEPPPIGPLVSLAFENSGAVLAADIRPPFTDGGRWEMVVKNPQVNSPVRLEFAGVEGISPNFAAILFDPISGTKTDLRQTSVFTFEFTPEQSERRFMILVGTPKFVATTSLVPYRFALEQNYPNPFNPATAIAYSLPVQQQVSLLVFNILGQKVRTLVSGLEQAGPHQVTWNGKDDAGTEVASGIYFYRLAAGDERETKKMLLVR